MKFLLLGSATAALALSLIGCSSSSGTPAVATPAASSSTTITNAYVTTATPYQPQQSLATYSAVPSGLVPVFTEAVVRHGSRGMSSFDATVYNMWQQAAADGALTPLGAQLGGDVWRMMKANALLDEGVAGITAPGYGNLTQTGINEQQQLAARLVQRLPSYFNQLVASASTSSPRQIIYVNSGVARALDSEGFFTQSLATSLSGLAPLLSPAAALTAYPASKPVAQAAAVNRFLLYFHKLAAKTDLVTATTDPNFQTYTNSLAYQSYLSTNANMLAKVNALLTSPAAQANAQTVLLGLFTQDFVTKIANGTYTFGNTGTFTFTSDDGKYSVTTTAPGGTTVQSLTDAASEIYAYYQVAPSMANEMPGLNFNQYIPDAQASMLAYLDDVVSYYQKGPGIQEDNPVTYTMAQILENDLFNEVDAIAAGNLAHGAKLRFTHAEEIIPIAALLGLPNAAVPTPNAASYTYTNNPWRGNQVAPLCANLQWDVFKDAQGALWVRMLFNEAETDFPSGCDSARFAPGSHFYNYAGLKTYYKHVSN